MISKKRFLLDNASMQVNNSVIEQDKTVNCKTKNYIVLGKQFHKEE
jgi:hypothetical protein